MLTKKNNTFNYAISLFSISILIHFIYLSKPAIPVFDETHYARFTNHYLNREFFMDVHPPLGRLIMAFSGYFGSFKMADLKVDNNESTSCTASGESCIRSHNTSQNKTSSDKIVTFPDKSYFWVRFPTALAGAILPGIIFLIILELGYSNKLAFTGGLLLNLENSLVIYSRYALPEAFILLFGFASLLLFLKAYKIQIPSHSGQYVKNGVLGTGWHTYMLLAGVLGAFAFSVKWDGLSFLGIAGIYQLHRYLESSPNKKLFLFSALYLAIIPILIYYGVFMIEYKILRNVGDSISIVSSQFVKSLDYKEMHVDAKVNRRSNLGKFFEENYRMLSGTLTLKGVNTIDSKWYEWPFMRRTIIFADLKEQNGQVSSMYLIGNPFLYLAGFGSVWYLIYKSVSEISKKKLPPFANGFVVFGYLINWLPFVFIDRDLFIYHYLGALVFALLAIVVAIGDRLNMIVQKHQEIIISICIVISLIFFALMSPLTYGFEFSGKFVKPLAHFAEFLSK